MATNRYDYRYEFSPKHDKLYAINNTTSLIEATLNLNTGFFHGKLGKVVRHTPQAFNKTTVERCLTTNNSREAFFIREIIYHLFNKKSSAVPVNFAAFLHDFFDSYSYMPRFIARAMYDLYDAIGTYTNTKRFRLTPEEAHYISDLTGLGVNLTSIVTHWSAMMNTMEDYNDWLHDYPALAVTFYSRLGRCSEVCDKYSYSYVWLLQMLKVAVYDGLVAENKYDYLVHKSALTNGASAIFALIDTYYSAIVSVDELDEPPIEEGLLLDYARVCALSEAKQKIAINSMVNSPFIKHAPVTFDDYTLKQVTTADELWETILRNRLDITEIIHLLQHHNFIVVRENKGKATDEVYAVIKTSDGSISINALGISRMYFDYNKPEALTSSYLDYVRSLV